MKNTLGFVGFGKMASAIASGILKNKIYQSNELLVFDVNTNAKKMAKKHKLIVVPDLKTLAMNSQILFLAVKPHDMANVLLELGKWIPSKTLIVTIAAGLPLAFYHKYLPTYTVIRTMPNTPAMLGMGVSGLLFPNKMKNTDKKNIIRIFNAVGKTCLVKKESDLNAVTALSGSGPAFIYRFVQDLISGGIKLGLSREDATFLTIETLHGALGMLATGMGPELLIQQVTSKKGTTLAGLSILKKRQFGKIVEACLKAANHRAKTIAQEALA